MFSAVLHDSSGQRMSLSRHLLMLNAQGYQVPSARISSSLRSLLDEQLLERVLLFLKPERELQEFVSALFPPGSFSLMSLGFSSGARGVLTLRGQRLALLIMTLCKRVVLVLKLKGRSQKPLGPLLPAFDLRLQVGVNVCGATQLIIALCQLRTELGFEGFERFDLCLEPISITEQAFDAPLVRFAFSSRLCELRLEGFKSLFHAI
jgi:hypothetical protein